MVNKKLTNVMKITTTPKHNDVFNPLVVSIYFTYYSHRENRGNDSDNYYDSFVQVIAAAHF